MSFEVVIQSLQMPSPRSPGPVALYFQTSSTDVSLIDHAQAPITLLEDERVSFDAFFNLFPVQHWNSYTSMSTFSIDLEYSGSAVVSLYQVSGDYRNISLVSRIELDTVEDRICKRVFEGLQPADFSGYLYLNIAATGRGISLYNYSVVAKSADARPISIAIVMCTYKRECFAKENIATILGTIDGDEDLFHGSRLVLVDNGRTITVPEHPKLTVIANDNLGGSGGFSRGILESVDAARQYTHILLCDDDICLPPETLRRTTAILGLLKDPSMGLHGGMLELERPWILHELGEFFDIGGRYHINPLYGRNMTNASNIAVVARASLEGIPSANMWGWWYTAFPIESIRRCLPLPFFMKGDDVEVSLRLKRDGVRCFLAPGIAVWHSSHMTQHNHINSYLVVRNRMVILALHGGLSGRKLLLVVIRRIASAWTLGLSKTYGTSIATLLGIEAFLRGPGWMNEGLDDWRRILKGLPDENVVKLGQDEWHVPIVPILPSSHSERLLRKWVRRVTLNGHLLSRWSLRPASTPQDSGHIAVGCGVSPWGAWVRAKAFRASSVLYYDHDARAGYRVQHDEQMFWRCSRLAVKIAIIAVVQTTRLPKVYQICDAVRGTESWWRMRFSARSVTHHVRLEGDAVEVKQ